MIKPEFTLHHGWGFSSSIWSGWIQDLEPEFEVLNLDRGYFGVEDSHTPIKLSICDEPSSSVVKLRVTVAHSFGLHLLSRETLASTDMLVCIGAFSEFLPQGDRFARRTLHRMQSRFLENPADVLSEFHYRSFDTTGLGLVGSTLIRDEQNWDLELLSNDLSLLETAKLDYSDLVRIPHILLLHGMNDIIVPPSRAYELQRYLPQSRLILHNSANHALPFLHMDWCLQHIMCYVDEIESTQNESALAELEEIESARNESIQIESIQNDSTQYASDNTERLQTPLKFKGMRALVGALDS
jgi:hypothetical protein